jgi:hypothetical protein
MSVGSADLAGLQAGATPALPPAAGRGRRVAGAAIVLLIRDLSACNRGPCRWCLGGERYRVPAAATSFPGWTATFCQMSGCVSPQTAIK